ncbi:MAG: cupin domain-containing protein [Candidatus Levyibacteriota bacterium]
MQKKTFNTPDETKTFPKTKLNVIKMGNTVLAQTTFAPGWKWSEQIKPIAGTQTCQAHHLFYGISGNLKVVMEDRTQTEIGPGDIVDVPAGHDAWVLGDEPFVAIDITSK